MNRRRKESRTLITPPVIPGVRVNGGNAQDSRMAPLLDRINALVDEEKISMEEYIGLVDELSKVVDCLGSRGEEERVGVDPNMSLENREKLAKIKRGVASLELIQRLYLARTNRSKILGEDLAEYIRITKGLINTAATGEPHDLWIEKRMRSMAWDDDWRKALNDVRYLMRICKKIKDVDCLVLRWLDNYKAMILKVFELRNG